MPLCLLSPQVTSLLLVLLVLAFRELSEVWSNVHECLCSSEFKLVWSQCFGAGERDSSVSGGECPKVRVSFLMHFLELLFYCIFCLLYRKYVFYFFLFFYFGNCAMTLMVCQCNFGILVIDKHIPIIQMPKECKRLTKKCSESNI